VLKITHNAGFFSCCTIRLEEIIKYFNNHKSLPSKVDSSEQFKRYKIKQGNVINEYFNENAAYGIQYSKPISISPGYPQFLLYKTIKFSDIKPFVVKYFTLSEQIKNIIRQVEEKYDLDYNNICSVYYRGTDKRKETNIAPYEEFINKVEQIKSKNRNIKLLLQTDESGFEEKFKHVFPNSIVISEVNNPNKFIHSLYLLSAANIISRTKIIICGSGNMSFWIMLYRGNSNNVHQYFSAKEYIYGFKNKFFNKNQTMFWFT